MWCVFFLSEFIWKLRTEVGKVRIEGAPDQKSPSFAVSARKILESLETHMKRKPVKKTWYNHPELLYTHTHT